MRLFESEFFKDSQGRKSMTLLLLFLSFWPASYAMVIRNSPDIYMAYIAAFTGLAINKQWAGRKDGQDSGVTESVQVVSPSGTSVSIGGSGLEGGQLAVQGKPTGKRTKESRRG